MQLIQTRPDVENKIQSLHEIVASSKEAIQALKSRYEGGQITKSEYGKGINKEIKRVEDTRKELTSILNTWSSTVIDYTRSQMEDATNEVQRVKDELASEGKGTKLIDSVEIIDIRRVPPHLIVQSVDKKKVKSMLDMNNTDSIDGLRITYKTSIKL